MIRDNRIGLQKNSQITLISLSKAKFERVFFIEEEISRGGSAICYKAYWLDENDCRVAGTLKEFYPCDFNAPAFDLARDDSIDDAHKNQLFSHRGTLENFLRFKKGYKRPYDVLSEIRGRTNEYPEAEDLNNYLPSYELYRGVAPEGAEPENCTVYIWVANEPGFKTYRQVLDDICKSMASEDYDGVKDLHFVLSCLAELAKAIDTLHLFSLYHLDLRPENFGIATYRDKPKENIGISLYDLNSLYSGRDRDSVVLSLGSEYFRSPEVAAGNTRRFGPSSDVYSLGALLFYSLVVDVKENEETKLPELYHVRFCEGKKEFDENEYRNIGVRLRSSLFLSDSDETQNSILFRQLYAILQKSLNLSGYENNNGAYATAEEFAEDLRKVIESLKIIEGPAAIDAATDLHAEVSLRQKEEHLAAKNKNGASGVIQWLLYKYPLYDYCVPRENGEDGCSVLVLGGGTFASKFIDLAFELSQVKNCRLDITVASNNAGSDKETYLATRPGMADFFEIDGAPAGRKELAAAPYGKLSFRDAVFPAETETICREKKYTYVFISLNDEALNEESARLCEACLRENRTRCLVSYTAFDEKKETLAVTSTMVPCAEGDGGSVTTLRLSVFDSLEKHKEYESLRRMAFNAHLTWATEYINDIPSARAKFKSKYNFNSSLENILSIRYKLHSVDPSLDLDFTDPAALAEKVTEIVGVPGDPASGDKAVIRELTMYEHRRWIVERVTDSWQTLKDLSQLHGDTKDKGNRLHPCIVPSGEAFLLGMREWERRSGRWETATEKDIAVLDGLDRLSILMHQHFVRETEALKKNQMELEHQKKLVGELTAGSSFAASVWNDLEKSIGELLNNGLQNTGAKDSYRYYKKLLSGIHFEEETKQALAKALKKIDAILYPAIQAASYTNWKKVDEDLIRSIPFILTYSPSFHLCVPFFAETNGSHDTTSLFENVASSLMLNPLNLTFLADGEIVLKDPDGFRNSLEYCARILENHRLQTCINVVVLRKNTDRFDQEAKEALLKLSDKIRLVDEIVYSQWNQVKALREYLSQKSKNFTAIEINKTRISGLLQSANELAAPGGMANGLFPMYSFDSRQRRFQTTEGCAFLTYVRNSPSLLINDLFYSRGKDVAFAEPELIGEHAFLWELYTGNSATHEARKKCTSAWKALCGAIKAHQSQSDRLAMFSSFSKNPESRMDYETCFPSFCQETVEMVMRALDNAAYKFPFFRKSYSITRVDSASCRLTIKDVRRDIVAEIENLLMRPACLVDKDLVDLVFTPEYIEVKAFSLRVDNLKLPEAHTERCLTILQELNRKKCIRSCIGNPADNTVSFTFSTEHYMRLMSNEGNILELHIYRQAISSNLFDDVKNSATVYWSDSRTKNEIDVIMVKGFETYIVEAKATFELKPEFYDKLYPLTRTFGINNIPVIIADLNGRESAANTLQIKRGNELGIRTITKADDPIKELTEIHIV